MMRVISECKGSTNETLNNDTLLKPLVVNCRGNIATVLIQYLIYKIGIYKPSSNANSYYSLLILRKLRAESVHKF